MTRRAPLQTLALAMLVATLACALHPAPALADPDQGRDQRHGEKHSNVRSDEQHQSGNDNRGNNDHYRNNDDRYNGNDNRDPGNDDRYHGNDDRYHDSDDNDRGSGRNTQQRQALSPQGAAQQARAQYGGQVLKVQPSGRGYQVRLLKDDGRVVNVSIGD